MCSFMQLRKWHVWVSEATPSVISLRSTGIYRIKWAVKFMGCSRNAEDQITAMTNCGTLESFNILHTFNLILCCKSVICLICTNCGFHNLCREQLLKDFNVVNATIQFGEKHLNKLKCQVLLRRLTSFSAVFMPIDPSNPQLANWRYIIRSSRCKSR